MLTYYPADSGQGIEYRGHPAHLTGYNYV